MLTGDYWQSRFKGGDGGVVAGDGAWCDRPCWESGDVLLGFCMCKDHLGLS